MSFGNLFVLKESLLRPVVNGDEDSYFCMAFRGNPKKKEHCVEYVPAESAAEAIADLARAAKWVEESCRILRANEQAQMPYVQLFKEAMKHEKVLGDAIAKAKQLGIWPLEGA